MISSEKRVYGKIKNIGDLVDMQAKASELGLQAVGITDNGSMYVYDAVAEMAKQITSAKAQEILEFSDDELSEFISTRGEKDIHAVVVQEVENPTVNLPEEKQEDDIALDVENTTEGIVEVVQEKADEANATFQEETLEVPVEDGPSSEDEEQEVQEPVIEEVIHECPACEDCSVHIDKIALAKASILQKIEQVEDFKLYLEELLRTLE